MQMGIATIFQSILTKSKLAILTNLMNCYSTVVPTTIYYIYMKGSQGILSGNDTRHPSRVVGLILL